MCSITQLHYPVIGILSMGTMGTAIASILLEEGYSVLTTLHGRSDKTKARAASIGVKDMSLTEVVRVADMILSIIPPADAFSTAQKVADEVKNFEGESACKCVYVDLNAISKARTLEVSKAFEGTNITYVDGSILGRPPVKNPDGQWTWFTLLMSGPQLKDYLKISEAEVLISTLHVRHVGDDIGAASGLKMCFGSFYKGQAAIMIQAYTTAANLGCLSDLQGLLKEYSPSAALALEASVVDMQHKAYRWITEMEEIGETFNDSGGWSKDLYHGVGEVYKVVDENTKLGSDGKEFIPEIVAEICKGLKKRKQA